MGQISNIAEGWKNYLSGKTSEKERERASLCRDCPFAVVGKFEKLLPDFQLKEVQGLKCGKCTCSLVAKIRSKNESCPIGKW